MKLNRLIAAAGIVAALAGCTSVKVASDGSLRVIDVHPFRLVQNAPAYKSTVDSNGVKHVELKGYAGDTSQELAKGVGALYSISPVKP